MDTIERSAEDITARCKRILGKPDLMKLANGAASPTAAYDFVFDETQNKKLAQAARWLRMLLKKYPAEHAKLMAKSEGGAI